MSNSVQFFLRHPVSVEANGSARLLNTVRLWFARVEQRRLLLDMDDRRLRDLGLTRGDAVRESLKGFWEK